MGTTPVITALLKSCYVMANQFPRAGREPTAYGSEVARSTNSATVPPKIHLSLAQVNFAQALIVVSKYISVT